MPVENGVGWGVDTMVKNEHFEMILKTNMKIGKVIIDNPKNDWIDDTYHYIDLTAGPGIHDKYGEGSPLRYLRLAEKLKIVSHAILIEEKECNVKNLRSHFYMPCFADAEIFLGRYQDIILAVLPFSYSLAWFGLLYVDPSGQMPVWDMLATLSQKKYLRQTDFLIHVSATNKKRIAKSPACVDDKRLTTCFANIRKSTWLIREPVGKHQWTFLLGTNWANYPKLVSIGFHHINSREGREIAWRIDFTRSEQDACAI